MNCQISLILFLERDKREIRCDLHHTDVNRPQLDTASVLAEDNAEVALLTPAGAPRVTDDPVVGRARLTPADGDNGVVDAGGAARGRDDTLLVVHDLVGVEANRDGTGVDDLLLDGVDVLLGKVTSGRNLRLDLLGVELAAALACLVRVGRVEHDTLLGSVGSLIGPATVAAIADLVAIDHLLLREHRRSLLVLLSIANGHHTDSREGPAGAALTLVADCRDPLLLASIERGRKSRNLLLSGCRLTLNVLREVELGENLLREAIRKRSHTVLSIITGGVELSSIGHVLVEDLIATLFLGVVLIGLAEGGLVCLPEGIVLEGHGAGSSSEKGKCINSLHVLKI